MSNAPNEKYFIIKNNILKNVIGSLEYNLFEA
jgi:hypothetical protein